MRRGARGVHRTMGRGREKSVPQASRLEQRRSRFRCERHTGAASGAISGAISGAASVAARAREDVNGHAGAELAEVEGHADNYASAGFGRKSSGMATAAWFARESGSIPPGRRVRARAAGHGSDGCPVPHVRGWTALHPCRWRRPSPTLTCPTLSGSPEAGQVQGPSSLQPECDDRDHVAAEQMAPLA